MKFIASNKYETAVDSIKCNMISFYESIGLEWHDELKFTMYGECALFDIVVDEITVGFFMSLDKPDAYYVSELHIDAIHRGKGYGSKALLNIRFLAGTKGHDVIKISAIKDSDALRLYETLDFIRSGEKRYTIELVASALIRN